MIQYCRFISLSLIIQTVLSNICWSFLFFIRFLFISFSNLIFLLTRKHFQISTKSVLESERFLFFIIGSEYLISFSIIYVSKVSNKKNVLIYIRKMLYFYYFHLYCLVSELIIIKINGKFHDELFTPTFIVRYIFVFMLVCFYVRSFDVTPYHGGGSCLI